MSVTHTTVACDLPERALNVGAGGYRPYTNNITSIIDVVGTAEPAIDEHPTEIRLAYAIVGADLPTNGTKAVRRVCFPNDLPFGIDRTREAGPEITIQRSEVQLADSAVTQEFPAYCARLATIISPAYTDDDSLVADVECFALSAVISGEGAKIAFRD